MFFKDDLSMSTMISIVRSIVTRVAWQPLYDTRRERTEERINCCLKIIYLLIGGFTLKSYSIFRKLPVQSAVREKSVISNTIIYQDPGCQSLKPSRNMKRRTPSVIREGWRNSRKGETSKGPKGSSVSLRVVRNNLRQNWTLMLMSRNIRTNVSRP